MTVREAAKREVPDESQEYEMNSSRIRDGLIRTWRLKGRKYLTELQLYRRASQKLINVRNTMGYEAAGLIFDGSNGDEVHKEMMRTDPEFEEERNQIIVITARIQNQEKSIAPNIVKLSEEKRLKTEKEAKLLAAKQEMNTVFSLKRESWLKELEFIRRGRIQTATDEERAEMTRLHNNYVHQEQDTREMLRVVYRIERPTAAMQGEWFRNEAEDLYRTAVQAYFEAEDGETRNAIALFTLSHQMAIPTEELFQIHLQERQTLSIEAMVEKGMGLSNFASMRDLANTQNYYIEDQIGIQRSPDMWVE